MKHFLLAFRNFRVTVRPKLFFREGLRMLAMSVQGQHHRCAFLHDSYPRMTATVDATLVALWQSTGKASPKNLRLVYGLVKFSCCKRYSAKCRRRKMIWR